MTSFASLRAFLQPLREMASAHDLDGVFWASVAFRNLEADICGNRQVKRILDSLGLQTLQLRHLSIKLGQAHAEQRLSDRERLVSAYEQRDVPLAVVLHGQWSSDRSHSLSSPSFFTSRRMRVRSHRKSSIKKTRVEVPSAAS